MNRIEENLLKVYRNLGATREPVVEKVNSLEEVLFRLFRSGLNLSEVLFHPWSYHTFYSRPATLDNGEESRVLIDRFEKYSDYYKFDYLKKSKTDNLVERIYDDYESEIDALQAAAIVEFPAFQLEVEEYMFLSDFSWVSAEISFFKEIVKMEGLPPMKDQQYFELLQTISDERVFFVTFPSLVMYCLLK